MQQFVFRVRVPHGGEQRITVVASNEKAGRAMAEAQTGGKVLGTVSSKIV